uniref:RING-type domain-containing protein n=1 Tax=viral metagenome TaxID=1070528 RepID=A0A6C0H9J6_9ZZZZ
MSKTKNPPKCTYCHHIGHNINNCKDPSIEILDKTILEKIIFITVLFKTLISHYEISLCVKELLNLLSYDELKILIYKKNLKKLTINDEKNTYVHYLRVNYQDTVYSYSNDELKQKLNEISDENYQIYGDEYLKTQVISDSFDLEELLLNRMHEFRPPQRKFDITITQSPTSNQSQTQTHVCPICLDEITPANQIITNCNHTFCNDCIQSYFKSLNSNNNLPVCAYCRDPMKSLEIPDPTLCKQIQIKYCNQEQDQEQVKLQIVVDNSRNIYREILVPINPPPIPQRPPENPHHFNRYLISIFYRFIGF